MANDAWGHFSIQLRVAELNCLQRYVYIYWWSY